MAPILPHMKVGFVLSPYLPPSLDRGYSQPVYTMHPPSLHTIPFHLGDPMAFHSFAAFIVLPADAPLSARALSASVRLEQSVVKLLVYAICHELKEGGEMEEEEEEGGGRVKTKKKREEGEREGGEEEEEEKEEGDVGSWAAVTRFGWPRRSRVGGFMIEYMTLRFISVTRRME